MTELISESQRKIDTSSNDDGASPHTDDVTATRSSIFDNVESRLRAASADEDTLTLWADIRLAFDEGSPSAVKAVIEGRVKQSSSAIKKDLQQVRSVTKSAAPRKKAAASKRAVKK